MKQMQNMKNGKYKKIWKIEKYEKYEIMKNEIRKEKPIPAPGKEKIQEQSTCKQKRVGRKHFSHARAHCMCENAWNQLFFAYRYFTPVFFLFLAREWAFPF